MGKAAEVASGGGTAPRNGGARDAGEVSRRCRTTWATTKYTAARRRIWARRTSTVTSPLSASRADEKQLPASSKQMRERRSRMGGVGRDSGRTKRQEGWATAKGDTMVGAHGRAAGASAATGEHATTVRDGAEARPARASRRVTPPASAPAAISRLHSIIGTVARASRSIIDLVFIYSGAGRS